jgi:hypothetical protein
LPQHPENISSTEAHLLLKKIMKRINRKIFKEKSVWIRFLCFGPAGGPGSALLMEFLGS